MIINIDFGPGMKHKLTFQATVTRACATLKEIAESAVVNHLNRFKDRDPANCRLKENLRAQVSESNQIYCIDLRRFRIAEQQKKTISNIVSSIEKSVQLERYSQCAVTLIEGKLGYQAVSNQFFILIQTEFGEEKVIPVNPDDEVALLNGHSVFLSDDRSQYKITSEILDLEKQEISAEISCKGRSMNTIFRVGGFQLNINVCKRIIENKKFLKTAPDSFQQYYLFPDRTGLRRRQEVNPTSPPTVLSVPECHESRGMQASVFGSS